MNKQEIKEKIHNDFFENHNPEREDPLSYHIIDWSELSIYIRDKGVYYFNGEIYRTLTLANISIAEQYQNQGIGSLILDTLIQINPYKLFVVEVVNSKTLKNMLIKRGFQEDNNIKLPDLLNFSTIPKNFILLN